MDDDKTIEITITVPDPSEVGEWAEENIPGKVQEIVAYETEDDRYRCRIRIKGPDEAVALKMVFDGRRA